MKRLRWWWGWWVLLLATSAGAKPKVLDIQTKCETPGSVGVDYPDEQWQSPLFNVSNFSEVGVITVCLVEKLLFSLTQAYTPSPTCPAGRYLTPIRLIHDLERFAAPETHLQLEFRAFNISRLMSSSTRAQLGVLYPRIVHRLAQSVSASAQYFGRNWRAIYRFLSNYLLDVLHFSTDEASFHARECLFRFYLTIEQQRSILPVAAGAAEGLEDDLSSPALLAFAKDASVAAASVVDEPVKCELHHNGEELEEHCLSLEAESVLSCERGRSCRSHTFDGYRCHCPAF